MRMFTEVGRRVHLHATGVGKALLSQMPDSAVRRIMTSTGMPSMTDRTITDLNVLLQVLAEIRKRGHTIDDGEHELGVRCVAVPVPSAPTPTAISVSGPESRLTPEVVDRVVPLLRETATAVAKHFA
jgi:IclR family acetate operon transcriptional repressor